MKFKGVRIKCGLLLILMVMSSKSFASPQYKIEVSVESEHRDIYFDPFYVSEGSWGKTDSLHCVYRGNITQKDNNLLLESKMDCREGKSQSHYEMPIFVVEQSGGDVSITYEDGDGFWKYSATITPKE